MHWFAKAPSNIALIKYMGKLDTEQNIPMNPSLSYTLNNLVTHVELEAHNGNEDLWKSLSSDFTLTPTAQHRFLKHLARLKGWANYSGAFIVRSSNNFPLGSGLASSASSFAALTQCAIAALCEITDRPIPSIATQASLSRAGSGSSCRSFFSPWALWDGETVTATTLPYDTLLHQAIVISHGEKKVSSSEAHIRIKSSPLYATRSTRATERLHLLLNAFSTRNWLKIYQLCWDEFQDLHQLFATASAPFSYITPACEAILSSVQQLWQQNHDGPIVTMDAGPNIHLLYRPDQARLAERFKCDQLVGRYDVL